VPYSNRDDVAFVLTINVKIISQIADDITLTTVLILVVVCDFGLS